VLFDEIEKASDSLWKLLLGILDKATLTLGDNQRVDFSQTIIFMTSNLGAKEMSELVSGSMGFAPAPARDLAEERVDQKVYAATIEAARRHFSPEFMNRIDKIVSFRSLRQQDLDRILDLEIAGVERRLAESLSGQFTITLTDEARKLLLVEGTDNRYGARHLKRSIEKFLVHPFANLSASGQVHTGDVIVVDSDEARRSLTFFRDETVATMARATLERTQAMEANDERMVA
jgi:ATP-dependent Clp protease ATP-binding subunit ClpA